MTAQETIAYTDGACSGNPGPGGWAWAVPGGAFASGHEERTTNQRMEIKAALEAVRANPGRLEIVSDSTYVVNCFRDSWWRGWLAKGWVNSQKKPVANRDLWEPLIDLYRERGDVTFRWVKGHSSDPMNDLVDRLAVEATVKQEGRSGDRPPTELGPPDSFAASASAGKAAKGPALPEGWKVAIAGVKPPDLGGYGPNPTADRVRARIAEVLAHRSTEHPDLLVVTGVALGAEQLGAEAAINAGVPYVAVLPYPGYGSVWAEESQRSLKALLADALLVVTLEDKEPTSKQAAAMAIRRRDAWVARHADAAIAVTEPDDATYQSLVMQLGDDDVFLLRP